MGAKPSPLPTAHRRKPTAKRAKPFTGSTVYRPLSTIICLLILLSSAASAQDLEELLSTPLSELMKVDVSLASGIEESIFEAPAALVVIGYIRISQRDEWVKVPWFLAWGRG